MGAIMTSIEDFLQWWDGFRSAIDPNKITKEHLDIIDRKINGLQQLWDFELPTREEDEPIRWSPNEHFFPYITPIQFPKITPGEVFPRVPDIWCKGMPISGDPINPPHVGTPLRHYN
jgi:hypothetical protein